MQGQPTQRNKVKVLHFREEADQDCEVWWTRGGLSRSCFRR